MSCQSDNDLRLIFIIIVSKLSIAQENKHLAKQDTGQAISIMVYAKSKIVLSGYNTDTT
jgi:hypothetical protein